MENAMILLYDICRLCLDEPGMDNIFKPVDMSQDIFTFTGVKVTTSDKLPQTICTSCRDIINCVKVLKDIANLNDNHLKAISGNNDENGCNQVLKTDSPSHLVIISQRTTSQNNQKESCDLPKITSSSVNKSFKNRIIFEGDTDKFKSKTEKLSKKKRKYSSIPETITNAAKIISVRKDLFDSSTTVTSTSSQHIKSSPNKDSTSNECSEKERKGDENAVASSKPVTSSTKKCIPFSTPTSSPNMDPEKTVKVGDKTLKVFKFEHQCETCNKTYSTPKKLYLHQLAHNKKFICPLDACGKKFAIKGDLQKHIRSHTGEKPFKCNLCEQSFTQNGSLKTHKENKHNEPQSQSQI